MLSKKLILAVLISTVTTSFAADYKVQSLVKGRGCFDQEASGHYGYVYDLALGQCLYDFPNCGLVGRMTAMMTDEGCVIEAFVYGSGDQENYKTVKGIFPDTYPGSCEVLMSEAPRRYLHMQQLAEKEGEKVCADEAFGICDVLTSYGRNVVNAQGKTVCQFESVVRGNSQH